MSWPATAAGTRYGRLVLTADRRPGEKRVAVRCDCGTEKRVTVSNLRQGITRSCGCLRREVTAGLKASHGMSGTPEYEVWGQMVARCTNPKHPRYADYGGRGIDVDPRWLQFEAFIGDMGRRPEGGERLTLERRDNDRGYWPDNCVWASYSQQARNRRGPGLQYRTRDGGGRFAPGSTRSAS